MSSKQYGNRVEKKVSRKAKTVAHDVQSGAREARAELERTGRTAGRNARRAVKIVARDVEHGGKRIGAATRKRLSQASARIKARRRTKVSKG